MKFGVGIPMVSEIKSNLITDLASYGNHHPYKMNLLESEIYSPILEILSGIPFSHIHRQMREECDVCV